MMQPSIVAFPNSCLSRRGFNSLAVALLVAKEEQSDSAGRLKPEPYTCPHCGLLHLREKAA